jgi:YD repeat-containing protein
LIYHPASGHLMGKRDAAGLGYSYTWHHRGLFATRTNARGTLTSLN